MIHRLTRRSRPRSAGVRLARATTPAVSVLATALLGAAVCGTGLSAAAAVHASPAAAVHEVAAAEATVQILGITPRRVDTTKPQPVKISIRMQNNTSSTLSGLSVEIQRGNPIQTEAAMTAALLKAPATNDLSQPVTTAVPTLAAGATETQQLTTTTDVTGTDGTQGLCLNVCNYGVYPIDVVLRQLDSTDGVITELNRDHTFVPSFVAGAPGLAVAPAQNIQLSWIWPLLDEPHRGASNTEFTDDKLLAEITGTGRLANSLAVLQQVQKLAPTVRMTLVVDPELIDELTVMGSPTGYTIPGPHDTQIKGTGGPAAQAFLAALKAVAVSDDISMTGYADPDVSALADNGVRLPTLPAETKAAVDAVFGTYPAQDITWPAGAEISASGLNLAAASGSSAVLLNDDALPTQPASMVTPNALSPLNTDTTPVSAVVLDSGLQKSFANVIASSSSSRWVQTLQAQLAVRAAQEPTKTHYIAIAPPRNVTVPNPTAVAQTIEFLSTESWSTSLPVRQALTSVSPYTRGALIPDSTAAGITTEQLSTLSTVSSQVTLFSACLGDGANNPLLAYYPNAIARAESSWWRSYPSEGQAYADSLRTSIDGLISKVRIVLRRDPSYTLASDGAPIPVTVENDLDVPVTISVRIREVAGVRGFRTNTVAAHKIGAQSRVGISVITHVARSGRFPVNFFLTTPDGQHDLSGAQPVRIHSNALGAVALWITGIAFAILVLAVILRAIRRLIRSRRPQPPAETTPELIAS